MLTFKIGDFLCHCDPTDDAVLLLFPHFRPGAQSPARRGVIVPARAAAAPTPPIADTDRPAARTSHQVDQDRHENQFASGYHARRTGLSQRHDVTLEGTYFFPIPESASIAEFAIWDGDRRLVGEVRTREEARRIYDEIVRRQRDPGLLEYAGKDLFQASIFPILPHSDKKLEITYTQVVRAEGGTVSYRYPLGTGRQLTQIGSVAGRVEVESQRAAAQRLLADARHRR